MRRKIAARAENMASVLFWKKKYLEERFFNRFEAVPRGSLSERKGKFTPCRGTEDGKGARTNSGKSGTRNLDAESIGSRAGKVRMCTTR